MCGILGVFNINHINDFELRLNAGMHKLKHRGPDDNGIYQDSLANGQITLGQTRLSIIDLTQGGHQPMKSQDGRYVIVFNGEIYNYKELRQELRSQGHHFLTDSDTEVLLAAWGTWGAECLRRLVGMFAFAVLDRQELTLTCVRDAFGVKPFFYTHEGGDFLFASELPALLALKSIKAKPNWQRSYEYLVFGDYDTGADTFFEDALHLLPGHLLKVDLRSGSIQEPQRWWIPNIEERRELSFKDAAEYVRENFLNSIRMHLRSDVPVGAALSGGVDSSAVVCAMRHVAPDQPIHTFSYIASGTPLNEERWADLVNHHVGAISHKVIVTPQELARDLDDMIRAQGEPFGSSSIYAQYRVYQLAKDSGITVTLDGQGADEMLAGYSGYPGPRLRSLVETGCFAEAFQFLNEWTQWPDRNRVMAIRMALGEMTSGSVFQFLRRFRGQLKIPSWINEDFLALHDLDASHPRHSPLLKVRGRRVMAELAHSLTKRGLPSLLRHGDRNSMRFSVESRVPFLTLDQVDLMLSLPEHYLISRRGETKSIFRAAMRGIVPDEILDRKDKIGFQTPEKLWLTEMSVQVREWLRDDVGLDFLDQSSILKEFDDVIEGRKAFTWQVWRWINFIRWHQLSFS